MEDPESLALLWGDNEVSRVEEMPEVFEGDFMYLSSCQISAKFKYVL
jgi:hypothetical protein